MRLCWSPALMSSSGTRHPRRGCCVTEKYQLDLLCEPQSPLFKPISSAAARGCTIRTYGRGVGVPLNACPDGTEQSGLICYPRCAEGFRVVGPVCWPDCPAGFTDIGAFCQKPGGYGRGVGYFLWDWNRCNDENKQGCERCLALNYPKCAAGFHAFGCNWCTPDCPSNMPDTGTGCRKQSYGRGVGVPMICDSTRWEQSGAICYTRCGVGFYGVGPVCWASSCPATGNTERCLGMFCVTPGSCPKVAKQLAWVGYTAANLAMDIGECLITGNIFSCITAAIPDQDKADALDFMQNNFPRC